VKKVPPGAMCTWDGMDRFICQKQKRFAKSVKNIIMKNRKIDAFWIRREHGSEISVYSCN
jgi:hypothetical protein